MQLPTVIKQTKYSYFGPSLLTMTE